MHPARLSYLATKHRQVKAIVSREITGDDVHFVLECGHKACGAPHFDYSKTKNWKCYECGEAYVKVAPQYAEEFKELANATTSPKHNQ